MNISLRMCSSLHDNLTNISFFFGKICLVVIVFSYSYETVARYFFSSPTSWSNEIVGYALCIGLFMVLPELTKIKGHIAITFVLESLSPKISNYLNIVLNFLSGIICIIVSWLSFEENIRQISNNVMVIGNFPFPKIWISIWITYGFFSAGIYFLRSIFNKTPNGSSKKSKEAA